MVSELQALIENVARAQRAAARELDNLNRYLAEREGWPVMLACPVETRAEWIAGGDESFSAPMAAYLGQIQRVDIPPAQETSPP